MVGWGEGMCLGCLCMNRKKSTERNSLFKWLLPGKETGQQWGLRLILPGLDTSVSSEFLPANIILY